MNLLLTHTKCSKVRVLSQINKEMHQEIIGKKTAYVKWNLLREVFVVVTWINFLFAKIQ